MISIEEVRRLDKERRDAARKLKEEGMRTNVACPNCGEELTWDGYVNASNPPTVWADCRRCQGRELLPYWYVKSLWPLNS